MMPPAPPKTSRQRCKLCQCLFTPTRSTQLYCSTRCRKRAAKILAPGKALTRRVISLGDTLESAIEGFSAREGREPERSDFLEKFALVVEAELQSRTWQARLAQRREALKAATDPDFLIRRIVFRPGEPVRIPGDADAIGACSTDGTVGVVCVGTYQRMEGPRLRDNPTRDP